MYYLLHTLGNRGYGNTAWVGNYKGVPMLFAERDSIALALACTTPWLKRSVGFVGVSDGWQDLLKHKQITWVYSRAENGNVALTGEVNLQADTGGFVLALGFGRNSAEAGHRALASLLDGYEAARWNTFGSGWPGRTQLFPMGKAGKGQTEPVPHKYNSLEGLMRPYVSRAALSRASPFPGVFQGRRQPGWLPSGLAPGLGRSSRGAAGCRRERGCPPSDPIFTDNPGTRWSLAQNMWLDGTPYWSGIQMDETAFPILLVDLAWREGALGAGDMTRLWPMVRRAAAFLCETVR